MAVVVLAVMSVGSLAYASHGFEDVPDSHTFHNAIDWMKDSGITVGCNPPANTEYCPEEGVTRGEMAAFLARAAASRTFDAGTLDGLDSTDFALAGDKASDSDLLDGKDSSSFVETGEASSDSELLDGKDSTEFLGASVTAREVTEAVGLGALDVTSDCQAGEILTGGGFATTGGLALNVTDSNPTGDGWHVAGTVTLAGSITVYALCASIG
jgi:hypothetical protein